MARGLVTSAEESATMSTKRNGPTVHVYGREASEALASATMTGVVRDAYGPADVLQVRDVERPTIGRGGVLVQVRAAGLDRGAWHIMTGRPYLMRIAGFGLRRPKVPGLGAELAGVVEAVDADVTGLAPGDAVFGTGRASFAEYAAAPPGTLAPMPANLTFEQAAA